MGTILIKLSELIFSKRVTLSLLDAVEVYLESKVQNTKLRKLEYFAKNEKDFK